MTLVQDPTQKQTTLANQFALRPVCVMPCEQKMAKQAHAILDFSMCMQGGINLCHARTC